MSLHNMHCTTLTHAPRDPLVRLWLQPKRPKSVCRWCHSNQLRSTAPDVRRMQPATHDVFGAIVRDGLLLPGGMPRWDDILSTQDVDAIHAWLIAEQGALRDREMKLKAAGRPLDAPSIAVMSNF